MLIIINLVWWWYQNTPWDYHVLWYRENVMRVSTHVFVCPKCKMNVDGWIMNDEEERYKEQSWIVDTWMNELMDQWMPFNEYSARVIAPLLPSRWKQWREYILCIHWMNVCKRTCLGPLFSSSTTFMWGKQLLHTIRPLVVHPPKVGSLVFSVGWWGLGSLPFDKMWIQWIVGLSFGWCNVCFSLGRCWWWQGCQLKVWQGIGTDLWCKGMAIAHGAELH